MTLISDFILTIPYPVTPVIVPKSWKTLAVPHRQAIPLRTFSLRLERVKFIHRLAVTDSLKQFPKADGYS
jgi:hypothetical protein